MTNSSEQQEKPNLIARMAGWTRFAIVLAVLGIFIGSLTLLISSTMEMILAIWDVLTGASNTGAGSLRVILIEVVDSVLVAIVLYVIAIGLYQLFINPQVVLPAWLQTRNLNDLDHRLAGMSITVLGVIFVTVALESHGTKDILGFGLAIAAVIAAISFFLYQSGKHE